MRLKSDNCYQRLNNWFKCIIICFLIQTTLGSPRSGSPASHSLIRHPTQSAQTSHPTHPTPPQSTTGGTQSANQTSTQIPTKGIRAPRPSSTSSIPQISGPGVSTKTSVIFRNKNNAGNQSSQTIVDKIKHYNKSGQQTVSAEQSIPQIVVRTAENSKESTLSKRTSSSSGFSSAKSDSSASLCGLENSVSTVVANTSVKTKPSVTQTVSKTRTSNYSQNSSNTANTCLSLNSNTDSNINNNLSNQKKSEEIVANCENIKTNVSNISNASNGNKSSNASAKCGSIPVKRIQPPRSRPTSTIIDSNSVASTMASSSHSTSNTSLTTIAKPTAAVKGTSKVLPHEDPNRIASRKLDKQENQTLLSSEHSLQTNANSNSKMKSTSDKSGSQTQVPTFNTKPEPSIAMVSPIMAREQSAKYKTNTIDEEKCPNQQKQLPSKMNNVCKKSDKPISDGKRKENHIEEEPQTPTENAIQDSVSSSAGEGEEESASNSDVDSSLINIKPMPPLSRTSQFAFLRSNANHLSNGSVYQRYPNNYSSIENGYTSDCAMVNNNSRPVYRGCYSVAGSATGYISETDACSPHFRRNQLLSSKTDYMSGATHRHYNDTDR